MIDCTLIYLPKPFLKNPDAQAPLGIMYIASSLLNRGKTVELKNYASFTDEEAIKDLPESHLYGITATSLEILHANRFSKKIKEKFPNANIIVGGPGSYSEEFIDFSSIDSVFYGDGEITIHDVLKDSKNGKLKKKYIGETIHDLDILPYPSRELLKDKQGGDIFAYNKHYAEGDSTIILSSRGCAHKCSFCSAPALTYNNCLRFRDPDRVADEIKHVKETYGIKQFRFSDDLFSANKKRTLELCEAIGPLDVFWRVSIRVKPLDDEMVKEMKNAGCKEYSFGIESFDNKVLKGLNKNTTAEDNRRALELANKHGIIARSLMMCHTPFQDKETIEINKKYLLETPIDILALTTFMPLPGSDIYANPDKYNIELLDINLDDMNFYFFGPDGRLPIKPLFKQKNRSIEEFIQESEDFRDWVENEYKKVNKG